MAPHTWSYLGDTVSDATHHMYYRGQRIKEAYYRGEKIWGAEENGDDVRFIDWDGTILHQMSAEDFIRLSDWPSGIHPSKDTDEDKEWGLHIHLLDDGWNWDFEAAKAFVRRYRYLDIGAEYATENDAVIVRVEIQNDGDVQYICFKSSSVMDIDWGDGNVSSGSTDGTTTLSMMHSYSVSGNYVITITPQTEGDKARYGGLQTVTVYAPRSYLCSLEGLYGTGRVSRNAVSVYYGKSANINHGFCYNSYVRFVGFSKEVNIRLCAAGLWFDDEYAGTLIIPRATTYFNNSSFYSLASDANIYWNGGNGIINSALCKGIIYPDTWTGTNDLIRNAALIERYIIPPLCSKDIALQYIPTRNLKKIVLPSQDESGTSLEVSMPSARPSNDETRIYVEQPYEDYWKAKIGANTDWYQRIEVVKPVK